MIKLLMLILCIAHAAEWSNAVEVRHEENLCVSYQARLDGPFLVVRANLESGWHTFAMDNKQRAEEKLAGKRSLGIDHPTEIVLTGGLATIGPWYQSPPKDFSRPELRWYSWGFERQALFVTKIRKMGAGPARIAIKGQACTETICKNIDVALSFPLANTDTNQSEIDLKSLVQVR
jgi:hypothetical protein